MQGIPDDIGHMGDVTAIGVTLGAFLDILPDATAVLAFIWLVLRVYEMETIQKLLRKPRSQRTRKDDNNEKSSANTESK